jgi:hypothetical protein
VRSLQTQKISDQKGGSKMKNIVLEVLSVFVFIFFSSISLNSFADISSMDDTQGGQDLNIAAFHEYGRK